MTVSLVLRRAPFLVKALYDGLSWIVAMVLATGLRYADPRRLRGATRSA